MAIFRNKRLQNQSKEPNLIQRAKNFINRISDVITSRHQKPDTSQLETETDSIPESIPELGNLDVDKLEHIELFNDAKQRIDELKKSGYLSPALLTFEEEGDFIPLTEIDSKEDLITEVTRLRKFTNDPTSQLDYAREYTYEREAYDKYGESFDVDNRLYRSAGFNPETDKYFTTLNYDRERSAWATFRKLKESDQAMIMEHYGYGQKTTQTLVAQIYEELGSIDPAEYTTEVRNEDGEIETIGKASDDVQKILHDRLEVWQKGDRNEQHRLNTFPNQTGDSGNFSSTADTGGDPMTKRSF